MTNGNDNMKLLEAAKERLRWYTLEASDEEFNEEEVDALVNLIQTLEPMEQEEALTNEQEMERFYAYVEQRSGESAVVASEKKPHKGSRLRRFVVKHRFVAAAVLLLLVIMVAGTSLGVVNAGKGNGFFFWLKADEEGRTMISSPENMDSGKNVINEVTYESKDEIPEEYRPYTTAAEKAMESEGYELQYIRITGGEDYDEIKHCYEDVAAENRVYVGAVIYSGETVLYRETYFGEEQEIQSENCQDAGFLAKENPEGYTEYTYYFYEDNVQCYVEGNADKDTISEIVTRYRDIISQ
ncbi:MAG: hypothetical protein E7291_01055 [Lachnospiraceae bacterium]|nr:hypothetical protein [Lachnospiraceae bacterium]